MSRGITKKVSKTLKSLFDAADFRIGKDDRNYSDGFLLEFRDRQDNAGRIEPVNGNEFRAVLRDVWCDVPYACSLEVVFDGTPSGFVAQLRKAVTDQFVALVADDVIGRGWRACQSESDRQELVGEYRERFDQQIEDLQFALRDI